MYSGDHILMSCRIFLFSKDSFELKDASSMFQCMPDILRFRYRWRSFFILIVETVIFSKDAEMHIKGVVEKLTVLKGAGLFLQFKSADVFSRMLSTWGVQSSRARYASTKIKRRRLPGQNRQDWKGGRAFLRYS